MILYTYTCIYKYVFIYMCRFICLLITLDIHNYNNIKGGLFLTPNDWSLLLS